MKTLSAEEEMDRLKAIERSNGMKKTSTRFLLVCALIALIAGIVVAYFITTGSLPDPLLTTILTVFTSAATFYFVGRMNKNKDE